MSFSRQRLAEIGIELWVPRSAVTIGVNNAASSIWRDVESEVSVRLLHNSPEPTQLNAKHGLAKHEPAKQTPTNLVQHQDEQLLNRITQIEDAPSFDGNLNVVNKPASDIATDSTAFEPLQTLQSVATAETVQHSWQIELCILDQAVLLVDAAHLSSAERALWQNIQSGLSGQFAQLVWPSLFKEWQEQRGCEFYIAGFFAAHAAQKKCFLFGGCAIISAHIQVEPMPSLSEMLAAPLLKKNLWQKIRDCNNQRI